MYTLSQVPNKMQQILTTTADETAHQHGFVERSRKLTGSRFVETLVFTWLASPDATYTELAQTAGVLGTPIIRQAIEQRFTPEAASTLKTTLMLPLALLNTFNSLMVPHRIARLKTDADADTGAFTSGRSRLFFT